MSTHDITVMLKAWRAGDESALERLTPEVYRELHRAAHQCMARERQGHTLQTTALINELYVHIGSLREIDWKNRAHFFAICARQMRRVLIDMARERLTHKRGGGEFTVSLDDELDVPAIVAQQDLLALDDALKALALVDERKSRVVELRFFGGLSIEDSAEVLNVSPETVSRDWRLARAWLHKELSSKEDGP